MLLLQISLASTGVQPQRLRVGLSTVFDSGNSAALNQDVYWENNVQDWNNTHLDGTYYASQPEHKNTCNSDSQGKEQLRTPAHPSGPVEPAFVAAKAQNFALSLVESVITTKIPLNNIYDTDVESLSSVETADNLAPSGLAAVFENIYGVPYCMPQAKISNFHLALGLWCDKEDIMQRAYKGLSKTLRLVNKVDEVHSLPHTLRTLQRWC